MSDVKQNKPIRRTMGENAYIENYLVSTETPERIDIGSDKENVPPNLYISHKGSNNFKIGYDYRRNLSSDSAGHLDGSYTNHATNINNNEDGDHVLSTTSGNDELCIFKKKKDDRVLYDKFILNNFDIFKDNCVDFHILWIAAFYEKKLRRRNVINYSTSRRIKEVLSVIESCNCSGFRNFSLLLLGICKIFVRQMIYLQHDCDNFTEKISYEIGVMKKIKKEKKGYTIGKHLNNNANYLCGSNIFNNDNAATDILTFRSKKPKSVCSYEELELTRDYTGGEIDVLNQFKALSYSNLIEQTVGINFNETDYMNDFFNNFRRNSDQNPSELNESTDSKDIQPLHFPDDFLGEEHFANDEFSTNERKTIDELADFATPVCTSNVNQCKKIITNKRRNFRSTVDFSLIMPIATMKSWACKKNIKKKKSLNEFDEFYLFSILDTDDYNQRGIEIVKLNHAETNCEYNRTMGLIIEHCLQQTFLANANIRIDKTSLNGKKESEAFDDKLLNDYGSSISSIYPEYKDDISYGENSFDNASFPNLSLENLSELTGNNIDIASIDSDKRNPYSNLDDAYTYSALKSHSNYLATLNFLRARMSCLSVTNYSLLNNSEEGTKNIKALKFKDLMKNEYRGMVAKFFSQILTLQSHKYIRIHTLEVRKSGRSYKHIHNFSDFAILPAERFDEIWKSHRNKHSKWDSPCSSLAETPIWPKHLNLENIYLTPLLPERNQYE